MNVKEFIAEVKLELPTDIDAKLSHKELDVIIKSALHVVTKSVKQGEIISLKKFGTFSKFQRAQRIGVNPSTGERIIIAAKNVLKFKPSDILNLSL